jgi:hypothetical protein
LEKGKIDDDKVWQTVVRKDREAHAFLEGEWKIRDWIES